MWLNDYSNDEDRQRLLPYVTRLACADTPKIEKARKAYIYQRTRDYRYGVPIEVGLEALEGALAIGRQADPLGPDEVQTRMDAARTSRAKPTKPEGPAVAQGKPFFSKVKSWLTKKEIEPAA